MAESDIIDFSASINPLGVPESVQAAMKEHMRHLGNYPDPDTKRLRVKISDHIGVDIDSIVCGNGSTELIYLIARALRAGRVLIPEPTFSEYERACGKNSGVEIVKHSLARETGFNVNPEDFIRAMEAGKSSVSRYDMIFLCNPNNPTGRLIKREDMLRIVAAAKDLKCTLVVDEAFIDFCPGSSVADQVGNNPYLIVLRSLTKMYALSGLRVGYGVFPPLLARAVKEAKEPWTVNTLAQIAGAVALDDKTYQSETLRTIATGKRALEEGFSRLSISYIPSAVNYYLLHMEKAQAAAAALRMRGILVRDCSNFSGLDGSYLRIAVKSGLDNGRLLKEISSCPAS